MTFRYGDSICSDLQSSISFVLVCLQLVTRQDSQQPASAVGREPSLRGQEPEVMVKKTTKFLTDLQVRIRLCLL